MSFYVQINTSGFVPFCHNERCRYGATCYRKNPDHHCQFSHGSETPSIYRSIPLDSEDFMEAIECGIRSSFDCRHSTFSLQSFEDDLPLRTSTDVAEYISEMVWAEEEGDFSPVIPIRVIFAPKPIPFVPKSVPYYSQVFPFRTSPVVVKEEKPLVKSSPSQFAHRKEALFMLRELGFKLTREVCEIVILHDGRLDDILQTDELYHDLI